VLPYWATSDDSGPPRLRTMAERDTASSGTHSGRHHFDLT